MTEKKIINEMAVLTCFVIQKNRDNLSDVVRESPKEKE